MLAISRLYFDNIRSNTSFGMWLWSVLGRTSETIDYMKYSSLYILYGVTNFVKRFVTIIKQKLGHVETVLIKTKIWVD